MTRRAAPRVRFEGSLYALSPAESVLDALIRGGAKVDFSCRRGTCQTCMLQVVSGAADPASVKSMRPALVDAGMFLPCCSRPTGDLELERPDLSKLAINLQLAEKQWLSPLVCRLSFEPETQLSWRAGQFINLRRDDGVIRSYSIASIQEQDYFLTIHVKRIPGGEMSEWLCDELQLGEVIEGRGPAGKCFYEPEKPDKNLLLLATGSGLAPLYGVCRDALLHDHTGHIFLYHTSKTQDGLYLRDALTALAEANPHFHYTASLSHQLQVPNGVDRGRIIDVAFGHHAELQDWLVYLCGVPEMVHQGRHRAVLAGVDRADIRADPFDYAHRYMPDDSAKIAATEPELELWRALDEGPKLTRILRDFYDIAYADARLAPFFHSVTKQRAIEQQHAFLADLFTGKRTYFGLRPFNAHHWMVITDELFDYREALLMEVARSHGLSEAMLRRWTAMHEIFRREIVKGSARGMVVDGEEQALKPPERVVVECASMCDGCEDELPAGADARFHPRGGKLFCMRCAGVSAGQR